MKDTLQAAHVDRLTPNNAGEEAQLTEKTQSTFQMRKWW
jgi:hypothetical protein